MTVSRLDLDPERRPLLPTPPTRIVGRERDLETICHLILDEGVRILSLTGPGGVGKTRLALEVAHAISHRFSDGAWWIDLAPLHEVEQVLAVITTVLRIETDEKAITVERLIDDLRKWHALLVLDNIEQLVNVEGLVAELIAGCPRLCIVVTGRSPLSVRAEQRYVVQPLPVSISETLSSSGQAATPSAVELFAERAQSVAPGFRLTDENASFVAEICVRLDGLPLAIELVASQAHVLSPGEMLDQLDRQPPLSTSGARDLPARQQTLNQTIAWSYDLLATELQVAFRRLAVFAGGFSLDAAAAILGDSSREGHTVDVSTMVGGLVERSLLTREEAGAGRSRFRLLGLTRAYALQQLSNDTGRESVLRDHARHFMMLAAQAEARLEGPDASVWMDRLEADHDNLCAALAWGLDAGDRTRAARMAIDLGRYWFVRGRLREGRMWLERVLDALSDAPTPERVGVLSALGALAGVQGDADGGARRADEALRLARELGDGPSIAKSLHRRGNVARGRGSIIEAATYYEEALVLFRQLDDEPGAAAALNNLGIVAAHRGDTHRARTLLEDALRAYRHTGNQRGMAITLCNLGQRIAEVDGNQLALGYYQEALPLFQSVGDTAGIAWVFQALAVLAAEEGIARQAAQLYGAAEAHRVGIGWTFSALEQDEYDRHVVALREHMGESAFRDAVMAGRDLTAERVVDSVIPTIVAETCRESSSRAQTPAGLTRREVQVLQLVTEGLTNGEIAHRLCLSPHTIDTHLRRIYRKLEVRSRSAASRLAVEHDLV